MKYYRMSETVQPPHYATEGSACFDLRAWIPNEGKITIGSGEYALVPTGLIFDIPENHSIRLHPRSGLAIKNGITLLNAEGVVDSDYIEEIKVILVNHGWQRFTVTHGMRICQAELVRNLDPQLEETNVKPVQKTSRVGGFGSTGTD